MFMSLLLFKIALEVKDGSDSRQCNKKTSRLEMKK